MHRPQPPFPREAFPLIPVRTPFHGTAEAVTKRDMVDYWRADARGKRAGGGKTKRQGRLSEKPNSFGGVLRVISHARYFFGIAVIPVLRVYSVRHMAQTSLAAQNYLVHRCDICRHVT